MNDLRSMDFSDMQVLLSSYGEPAFRVKQLFEWVHRKQVHSLLEAHNVSRKLIDCLQNDRYSIINPEVVRQQISVDATEKYLLRLADGELIESVLMKYRGDYSKKRNTLCVSSQVGCAMGCAFCATGAQGLTRNLTVGEIVSQVYVANQIMESDAFNHEVRNIVFMGMGEPMANFDTVLKAINILCDPQGCDLAQRRITISTCGLVKGIRALADMKTDIGLAISLHASNQHTRAQLMPIAKVHPLNELMDACRYYNKKSDRRISFEYALIAGVNDTDKNIRELKGLLDDIKCHMNLIPVNPVAHTNYKKPSLEACRQFQKKLQDVGLGATIREAKGADIEGACGQLRAQYQKS